MTSGKKMRLAKESLGAAIDSPLATGVEGHLAEELADRVGLGEAGALVDAAVRVVHLDAEGGHHAPTAAFKKIAGPPRPGALGALCHTEPSSTVLRSACTKSEVSRRFLSATVSGWQP
jgi:hypothetical protein